MTNNSKFLRDNVNLVYYLVDRIGKQLSKESREDLAHDVIIKILESEKQIEKDTASAYISKVIKNTLLNDIRDTKVDALGHADSIETPISKEGEPLRIKDTLEDSTAEVGSLYTTSRAILYKDNIDLLCKCLSTREAMIFRMRYYLGMMPREIAEKLGSSSDAIRTILKVAVGKARQLTSTVPSMYSKYRGLTIQEMALVSIPDKDLHPFLMRYTGNKSLMAITKIARRSLDSIKESIARGERRIQMRYGLNVRGH
jgi:RNA polymerase sigma factor (sigma-70 family)